MFPILILLAVSASAQINLCPQPENAQFYNGYCVYYPAFMKTWADAQSYCQSIGYNLITIDSEKSFNALNVYSWLGLRCFGKSPDSCFWGSLSKPTRLNQQSYSNFAPGHPNVSIGNCVKLDGFNGNAGQQYWISADCSEKIYLTCARPAAIKIGK